MEDTKGPESVVPAVESKPILEQPDLAQVDATTETLANASVDSATGKQIPAYVWAILAVFVLAGLGGLGYYFAVIQNDGVEDQIIEEEDEEDTLNSLVNEDDSSDWETWTGEYLSAKLPEGWSVEEIINEDPFYGFVGFNILSEDGETLVSVSPFFGSGYGICDCTKYYTYPDTAEFADDDIAEIESTNYESCGEGYINREDISNYIETEIFSKVIRFSDALVHVDKDSTTEVFDAGCDDLYYLLSLDYDGKVLNYNESPDADSFSLTDYVLTVGDGYDFSNSEEVENLAKVLETLTIINEVDWDTIAEVSEEGKTDTWENMTDYEQQHQLISWMKAGFTEIGFADDYTLGETQSFNYYNSSLSGVKYTKQEGHGASVESYVTTGQYEEMIAYWEDLGFSSEVVYGGDLIESTQVEKDTVGCVITRYFEMARNNAQDGKGSYDLTLYCDNNIEGNASAGDLLLMNYITAGNFIYNGTSTFITYVSNEVSFDEEMEFLDFYLKNFGYALTTNDTDYSDGKLEKVYSNSNATFKTCKVVRTVYNSGSYGEIEVLFE